VPAANAHGGYRSPSPLQVRDTEAPHDPAGHVHVYVATPLTCTGLMDPFATGMMHAAHEPITFKTSYATLPQLQGPVQVRMHVPCQLTWQQELHVLQKRPARQVKDPPSANGVG
jgi:hypothetical protein